MKSILPSLLFSICYLSLFSTEIDVTSLSDSGPGTLRQAMMNAHEGDLITFDETLAGTISLQSSLPSISSSYSIAGPSGQTVVIDGSSVHQIFQISGGFPQISSLTLINGNSASLGGCISVGNENSLTVTNVSILHSDDPSPPSIYIAPDAYLSAANLLFISGSSSSGHDIFLDQTAALDFSLDESNQSQFVLEGNGNFSKTGDGTAITGGASPLDITLSVNGGTLVFTGSTTEPIIANIGGIFTGNASMYYLVNNGTILPADEVSLLSMTGDYQQTSVGNLGVQINSTGDTDVIQVGGNAFLDGVLTIIPNPGLYQPGDKYVFLNSTGQVNNTFSELVCTDPDLSYSVNYHKHYVEILILEDKKYCF